MSLRAPAKDDGYYLVLAPSPISDFPDASLAEEAALTGERLRVLGVETVTVAHIDLHLGVAAKKIRALEVSDDSLTAIPTSGIDRVAARWDEVTLLVVGRLLLNRQEAA